MNTLQKTVIGNWKMYKNAEETKSFFAEFLPLISSSKASIGFSVPYIDLLAACECIKGSKVAIGSQNIYFESEGAFTGEISPLMVKSTGASFTLVGHSERRKLFFETDEIIGKKLKAALNAGLKVILCVGETLEERERGKVKEVLERQLGQALSGLSSLENLLLAYEPVWAIGTGKAATQEEAQEAHKLCRDFLRKGFGAACDKTAILYGGSVKAENVAGFVAQADVNGVLVGGASLKAKDFAQLINNC